MSTWDLPGYESRKNPPEDTSGELLPGNMSGENSPRDRSDDDTTPHTHLDLLSTPLASQSLTETRRVFSAITSFLALPVNAQPLQKSKPLGPARVLTSEESLILMKQKEKKKKEEEEKKEQKKKEREEKRQEREAEKKRKAEERERKAVEKHKRNEEKKAEQEAKRQQTERKRAELEEKQCQREQKRKEKHKIPGKVFVTRSKGHSYSASSDLSQSSTSDICCICSGAYEDDFSSNGSLVKEWVQCTHYECKLWMHEDCVTKNDDVMVCICGNVFQ